MAASGSGSQAVLVTGGTGYIGSHTVVEMINEGLTPILVDNLDNSCEKVLERIAELTGKPAPTFYKADLRDRSAMDKIFADHPEISSVIHFAGMKAVGESKLKPLTYFDNNVGGTMTLLAAMGAAGVKDLVFSSSCTVYGETAPPLSEDSGIGRGVTNAYGRTKFVIEEMLRDVAGSSEYDGAELSSGGAWRFALLRYFNPVGAHPSGRMGEDPLGIPNCLMPYCLQALVGRRDKLTIFGDDYPTPDGTCIRDYIHVVDVAKGHIDALQWLKKQSKEKSTCEAFNFGTGKGTSVFELVAALEKAAGKECPKVVGPRRPGDLPETFCDPKKAKDVLGWEAKFSIEESCAHAWKWQSENPRGYEEVKEGEGEGE